MTGNDDLGDPCPDDGDSGLAGLDPEPEFGPGGLTETVVHGAGLAGAGYAASQLLTLGFFIALARLASPEDFGHFAAGSLLVNIGLLFTESGMLAALIHREDRIDEAASTAVVSTAAAGLLFSLAALAASPLIGTFFKSATVGKVAAATSGLLLLRSLVVVPEALLQRRFSFFRRVIVQPIGVTVFGVAAVISCANGLGVWGLVIGYYAAAVADVVLSWALLQWRPQLRLASFEMWRELIQYGRHLLATNIVMRSGEQLPVLLLGRFAGADSLGQFRYADRMSVTPLALLVQAASYVLFPAFARIAADRDRFRGATLRSLRLMAAMAFPLGLLLVPFGIPAAILFFGEPWREAGYAAMILAVVPVAGTVVSFASEVLKADGRPDILTRIHLVIIAVSAVAMLALLPLGFYGVVGGVSIGAAAGGIFGMRKVKVLLNFSDAQVTEALLAPIAAAILMAALMTPIGFLVIDAASMPTVQGIFVLCAEAIGALAFYFALLWLFASDTAKELAVISLRVIGRGKR